MDQFNEVLIYMATIAVICYYLWVVMFDGYGTITLEADPRNDAPRSLVYLLILVVLPVVIFVIVPIIVYLLIVLFIIEVIRVSLEAVGLGGRD